jgi:hypothetical protein
VAWAQSVIPLYKLKNTRDEEVLAAVGIVIGKATKKGG